MKYVAFDLEATGVDTSTDRIIEIHVSVLDESLRIIEEWGTLVNPGIPIPQDSIEVHGITDDMVQDAPRFQAIADRVLQFLRGSTLIAYNHTYDIPLLSRELEEAGKPGIPINHPVIDPLLVERLINSHKLDATYKRYTGKDLDGAHRSKADVHATVEILQAQQDVLGGIEHAYVPAVNVAAGQTPRNWLDWGKKFYDDDGVIRFGFGKHDGKAARDEPDYLQWMLGASFTSSTKKVCEGILRDLGRL